jgi:hypothetical protein
MRALSLLGLALPAILFVFLGKYAYYTFKGMLLDFLGFQRGDRSGTWKTTYME